MRQTLEYPTERSPGVSDGVQIGRRDSVRVASNDQSTTGRVVTAMSRFGVRRWLLAIDALMVAVPLILTTGRLIWPAVAVLITLSVHEGQRLYRSRVSLSLLDDLPRIATGVALGVGGAAGTASLIGTPPAARWWLGGLIAFVATAAGRMVSYVTIRAARRGRHVGHRTLIVGTDPVARHLAELMVKRPASGLRPVAFFDPSHPDRRISGFPVISSGTLEEATFTNDAQVIVVAFGSEPDYEAVQRVRDAAQLRAEIFFVPRFHELQGISSPDMDHLYDVPLFRLRRWSHRTRSWKIKRAFDVVVAMSALVVLSPLLAVTALAIRLTMGSPLLFRQQRIGLDGLPFEILKFRSLPNAPTETSDSDWNSQATRQPNAVGRFIRAFSIDELPQLWNVVRGDMSLVGPRPERPSFVDDFIKQYPDYRQRHRVPVGITGLAQVEGLRGDTPIADRARFDNLYVENWSLWGDVKILCRTIGSVLRREGN